MSSKLPVPIMSHAADRDLCAVTQFAVHLLECQIGLICLAGVERPVAFTRADPKPSDILPEIDAERLLDPLTAQEEGFAFYCGIPLRSADATELGRLVLLDVEARTILPKELESLVLLSRVAADMIRV